MLLDILWVNTHFDFSIISLAFTCVMCLPSYKRVGLTEKERFPDSRPAREKPFKMYRDNRVINVRLTDLEEGWNFDKTDDTKVNCKCYSKERSITTHRQQVSLF